MAENAADELSYVLEIRREHRHYLAQIRHWQHLVVAEDAVCCRVTGFTPQQAESATVKSIPFARLFHLRNGWLFRLNGLVPEKELPASTEFVPIAKALSLTLPAFNHNYFGIQQRIPVQLVPGSGEQPACGMLVSVAALGSYLVTASAVRLRPLQWCLLNRSLALVLGIPLLPVQEASMLWQHGKLLLPAGYVPQWPILAGVLQQTAAPEGDLILWQQNQTWLPLSWQQFRPLSISSYRLTTGHIEESGQLSFHDR